MFITCSTFLYFEEVSASKSGLEEEKKSKCWNFSPCYQAASSTEILFFRFTEKNYEVVWSSSLIWGKMEITTIYWLWNHIKNLEKILAAQLLEVEIRQEIKCEQKASKDIPLFQ